MANTEFTVSVFSHHFVVTKITLRGRECVEAFARRYIEYGLEKRRNGPGFVRVPVKVYAAATQNRSEFRFHINQLKDFKESLGLFFLKEHDVEWLHYAPPEPRKVELPIYDHWSDREHQIPVIDYIVNYNEPGAGMVNLQTGKGKSYCSMRAGQILSCAIGFIMKPMYIDKWLIDIRKTYNLEVEDVMVVQGSKDLMGTLQLAVDGLLTAKVFIFSNKTLQNWIKLYEQHGQATLEMGYACTPDQLFQLLGIGLRVIDEVHQDFHLNFKIDLYTNVKHSVSLSATLLSDDGFKTRMYEIAYPSRLRYDGGALHKYIASMALIYRLKDPTQVRFQDWATKRYSHNLFEQSILRNKELTQNYFKLVEHVVKTYFIPRYRKKGDKMIIFASSIALCTKLTEYLTRVFPQFEVRRYVEEDPYENLMEPDLRVTTLLSAGTAVDIPGLTTTFLTTAVSSSQSNVQGLGRLRELADGTVPLFIYAVCEDISKHIEYHERKRQLLQDRASSYKLEHYTAPI